jgi:hypothetical protein
MVVARYELVVGVVPLRRGVRETDPPIIISYFEDMEELIGFGQSAPQ